MREGTIPPHWAELVRNSTEIATDKDFDTAKTWFEGVEDPCDTSPFDASFAPVVSLTPENKGAPSANAGVPSANEGATTQPNVIPPVSPSEGAGELPMTRPILAPVEVDDNDPYNWNATPVSSNADMAPF